MLNRLKTIKWRLQLYFAAATCLTLGLGFAGGVYSQAWQVDLKLPLVAVVVLTGPAIGYYAARQYQRRLDKLHLAIKQVESGNLTERIALSDNDGFDELYADFNAMLAELELKMKLLQKLGEENVLLQKQSNETAVLEERRRLARDLHDTVSQQLFAIHMSASALPKLMETNPDGAGPVMEQLIVMSQHAQKEMRGLIAQLRPLELEGRSLQEALERWFPVYCSQNGLRGKLDVRLGEALPEAIEHQLFLLVQEGMANVVKHARALNVSLALADAGRQYALVIADNGVGFATGAIRRTSYGLSTMRERAQRLGGDVEVLSRVGAGTTIRVHIPKFE